MEIITKSAEDTYKLGQKIGSTLKGGEVLALVGDLGSGKTTFMGGLSNSLQISDKIISPTFILMREHKGKKNLYHLDLYRLEENIGAEIKNLDLPDIWGKEGNIVVIEWADRAKDFLPHNTQWVNFEYISDTERKITYKQSLNNL